jgi:hypothetical protein
VTDALGWRAAFWLQVPAIALSGLLVIAKVDVPHVRGEMSAWDKMKRIDWAGCAALTASVGLIPLTLKG